jgi:hypothetical protein
MAIARPARERAAARNRRADHKFHASTAQAKAMQGQT